MSADYLLHDYDALLLQLIDGGTPTPNRTGTPARRMTGAMIRCDMRSGRVPVTTFKRLHWKSVVAELLWFLSGALCRTARKPESTGSTPATHDIQPRASRGARKSRGGDSET